MKNLYLLRHAKTVPGSTGLPDFERPLKDEGRRQAARVGKYFKEQDFDLDLVLSSTAWRARETTELFLTALECTAEVRYDQRIYEASPQHLLEVICEIEQDKNSVLLVGHNPGFEELLRQLTSCFESMSTGTLAKIGLEISDWTQADEVKGHLDRLVAQNEMI
jgi:phosphohistidine phosphatase